jgi:hypothetical protein
MAKRLLLISCAVLLFPLTSFAAPPVDRGTRLLVNTDDGPADMSLTGAAADWIEPGEGPSLGARVRYVTIPDAFFDPSVGLEFAIDGPARSRVVFGIDYTDLSMPPGNWRNDGEKPDEASYTEVDLHLITVDALFLWKARISHNVGFTYGVGMGVSYLPGTITSVNVLPSCKEPSQVPECAHWDSVTSREQDIDGFLPLGRFIPMVTAQVGLFYDPTPGIRIRVDAGFRIVFFTGLSVRSTF